MIKISLLVLILILIPPILNFWLASLFSLNREKPSAFECGFDPPHPARLPFSLRFYMIAVIFLVFDVEITLILPIPIIFNHSIGIWSLILSSIFMAILIWGLQQEWTNGALDWKS